MKTTHFTHHQAKGLLHNKFVIIMGGSNLRTMYKDLVLILQKNKHLTYSQLKTKGEATFENDTLLEGGRLAQMTNGTEYREVRQYTSDHHLIRFYFITRVYSDHMKKILEELENGLKPDLVIVNSCVWDISRYGRQWERDYLQNLTMFFKSLRSVLPEEVLIVWTMAMPLSEKIIGGFLVPEIAEFGPSLRIDVVEANFWSATLASEYGLDVLDMHFHFRFSLQHQAKDGVHWNAIAHRRITCLLLAHVAQAWGVELLPSQPLPQPLMQIQTGQNHHSFFGQRTPMKRNCQYSGKEQKPALTVTVNGLRPTHTKPYLLASTSSEGRQVRIMGPSQIRGGYDQWRRPLHILQGGHRDVQIIPRHHSQGALLPTPEPPGCSRDGDSPGRSYTPRAPYPLRDPYPPRHQPYPSPRQPYLPRQTHPPSQTPPPEQPYPPPRQQCTFKQPYPPRQMPKQPYPPRQIPKQPYPPRQTQPPRQRYPPPREPYPQRERFPSRREPYPLHAAPPVGPYPRHAAPPMGPYPLHRAPPRQPYPLHAAPPRQPYPLHAAPPRQPYSPHAAPPMGPYPLHSEPHCQELSSPTEPNECGGSWQYFNGLDPCGDPCDSQLASSKGGWIFVDMEDWSGCEESRRCVNGQDPYGDPNPSQLTSSEDQDFSNDDPPQTGQFSGASHGYALRRRYSGRAHYRPY